jgi:hypothetical protein
VAAVFTVPHFVGGHALEGVPGWSGCGAALRATYLE